MRRQILADLKRQPLVVRGSPTATSSSAQSTADAPSCYVIKFPRSASGTTKEEYVTTQLYIAERAVAVSEYLSKGDNESVTVLLDVSTYHKKYAPPLSWQFSAAKVLQRLYPERLGKVYLLKPPFWLKMMYKVLQSILSERTTSKVLLLSDEG